MGWVETVFQRESIYREIWAEPLRTVAGRYGISDAGLRKICKKLAVPMPPLGYWAKVAAGKTTRVSPLPAKHQGPEMHVRRVYVDELATERARRSACVLTANCPEVWPVVIVPEALDAFHTLLRRTAKAVNSRSSNPSRMVHSTGHDVFVINVSQAQTDRALRILHACVTAFIAAGAEAFPGVPKGPGPHLKVIDQFVGFKVEEMMDRSYREPTGKERAETERNSWFKPDLRVYTPGGKLKLTVLSGNQYSPYLSVSDGASRLDARIGDIVERVWTKAAILKVDHEIREEERRRAEAYAVRRRAQEHVRAAELKRLEETEEEVQRWRRAQLLRRYADALEAQAPNALVQECVVTCAWIRNAADWLDPLVCKDWPEVDIDGQCDRPSGDEAVW